VRRIPLLLADPFLVAVTAVWDLLLFAKNLFVAAKIVWHEVRPSRGERDRRAGSSITLSSGDTRSPASSLYGATRNARGHLNRSIDGIFEIVRVVSSRFVSIAEVHAIRARAHLAQSEPEMASDRFGLLEPHRLPFVAKRQGSCAIGCATERATRLDCARCLAVRSAPSVDLIARRTLATAAGHCAKSNASRACPNIESACLIAGKMR
jgi:hypothetical protein